MEYLWSPYLRMFGFDTSPHPKPSLQLSFGDPVRVDEAEGRALSSTFRAPQTRTFAIHKRRVQNPAIQQTKSLCYWIGHVPVSTRPKAEPYRARSVLRKRGRLRSISAGFKTLLYNRLKVYVTGLDTSPCPRGRRPSLIEHVLCSANEDVCDP